MGAIAAAPDRQCLSDGPHFFSLFGPTFGTGFRPNFGANSGLHFSTNSGQGFEPDFDPEFHARHGYPGIGRVLPHGSRDPFSCIHQLYSRLSWVGRFHLASGYVDTKND